MCVNLKITSFLDTYQDAKDVRCLSKGCATLAYYKGRLLDENYVPLFPANEYSCYSLRNRRLIFFLSDICYVTWHYYSDFVLSLTKTSCEQ